jgi:predicted secreted Zn-dependent protease
MCLRIITDNQPFLSPIQRDELKRLKQNACPSDFKIVKKFYDVPGATFDEVAGNLHIEAAKAIKEKTSSGKQRTGLTTWVYTYGHPRSRYVGSGGRHIAYPVGLKIPTNVTVTLPRWNGKERATKADKEKWDDLVGKLDRHEQYHVCIALDGFNELKMAFLGIAGMGETIEKAEADLGNKLKVAYEKARNDAQERSRIYDVETEDGEIDAKQKSYDEQVTQECRQCYPGK